MAKVVKKKKVSGGGRLKAQGKSLVWVSPDADQKERIRMAAAAAGKPMSQFLLDVGLAEADVILKRFRDGK